MYGTKKIDCDCSNVRRDLGEICCLHKQNQECVVCVINNPGKKSETDLDLDFVGGKNLTFFCTYHIALAVTNIMLKLTFLDMY